MRFAPRRRGFGAVDAIVAGVFALLAIACLLVAIPRGREASRGAACRRNLMQIGMGLALYHQSVGHLPSVTLGAESPFSSMLGEFAQPDFAAFGGPKKPASKRTAGTAEERTIPGLICPSDPFATAGIHPAPISYRANTGGTTDGQGGPFAIGRRVTLREVESADGSTYTAAFSERLVGTGTAGTPDLANYALVPGPVGPSGYEAARPSSWKADAGSSWVSSEWRLTLYSHLPPPNSRSCIADDGRTAFVGASSGHRDGVHVLLLDGSLKLYHPGVAPEVWRALGTIGESRE